MPIGGSADIVIVGYEHALVEDLESGDVFVAEVDWCDGWDGVGRGVGDFLSVFIGPSDKVGGGSQFDSAVTSNCVGCGCFVGVAHVARSVGVVDGSRDIKIGLG